MTAKVFTTPFNKNIFLLQYKTFVQKMFRHNTNKRPLSVKDIHVNRF